MSKDLTKAIRSAKKKISVLGDKALNSNLDHFCGSYADAFNQGVFETQNTIVERLMALQRESQGKEKQP